MSRYKKGQSGNPKGKPVGTKSRYTLMREALADDLPMLLSRTKEAALEGDMVAMRLLLERALPPIKATSGALELPSLATARTLTGKANAILSAISCGYLSPDVGSALISSLGQVAKLTEFDDLERRIEILEGMTNG